jgi:hypothetical protein
VGGNKKAQPKLCEVEVEIDEGASFEQKEGSGIKD